MRIPENPITISMKTIMIIKMMMMMIITNPLDHINYHDRVNSRSEVYLPTRARVYESREKNPEINFCGSFHHFLREMP